MEQVFCGECLRTYKPYTYSETIQRALVSGVNEWQGDDNVNGISSRYNNVIYIRLGTTGTIRNLFPSVQDFRDCHRQFNIERRKKIFASFLCFDCEKYLCDKCITEHSEHFTFCKDDKNNIDKWVTIETKIMKAFNTEGDKKEEHLQQERAVLCNVVDVRDSVSVTEWEEFMSSVGKDVVDKLRSELDRVFVARDSFILNDNQTFLAIYYNSTHMKIYNISSYELVDTIELPDIPAGITEIPSTDPSQTLIAVSFPCERRIDIMNIQHRTADVISSINVQGRCSDLAYCNNKLITLCENYLDKEYRQSIHVMDMKGEIINGFLLYSSRWLYGWFSMSALSENETIYVCYPYGVTCLSFTCQVLHSTFFSDMIPRHICVDRDQNVYVMEQYLPLYKLSSDLSEIVKIIDKDAVNVDKVTSIVHHKNKIYMASAKGYVCIFNVD